MRLKPAFEITIEFLDEWLEEEVSVLVVNDMVIHLRGRGNKKYPPDKVTENELEDDLPF